MPKRHAHSELNGDYGTTLSDLLKKITSKMGRTGRKSTEGQILASVGNQLLIVSSTRPDEIGLAVMSDDCVSGQALLTKRPVILGNVRLSTSYKFLLRARMRSEIAIPLPDLQGVLNVESPRLEDFTKADIPFLQSICKKIATVLPAAFIHFELEMLSRIEKEIEQTTAGSSPRDIYRIIYGLICDRAQKIVGAEHMQLLTVSSDGRHLALEHSSYATDIKKILVDKSICGMAVKRRGIVNIRDVLNEKLYQATIPGTRSELVVPAFEGQNVSLIINAESPRPEAFTRHHETLLALFAQQAGRSLRYTRLVKLLDKADGQKRATEAFAAAATIMTDRIHSYKSSFVNLRDYVTTIRDRVNDQDEIVTKSLEMIGEVISEAQSLTEDIKLDLQSSREIVQFELNAVVREAVHKVEEKGIPLGVTIYSILHGSAYVHASPFGLTRVVKNLINNAMDAIGTNGGWIKIQTRYIKEGVPAAGPCAELTITDTGGGMSQITLDRAFEQGYSTKQGAGSGFGLFWVKLYVDRFGGDIKITSELGVGTSVRILLPASVRGKRSSSRG